MQRVYHYITILLLVTTVACSGGGGSPAPDSGGGGTDKPAGDVKLPDGSIKKPDGSIVDPNGITKKQDGTVEFPTGTIKLSDGTFKLPNGSIAKADGTIISKGTLDVPGDDDKVIADSPFVITPTAVISGVKDGGLYSSQTELTASAADSKDAASYSWSLSGAGLAKSLGSTENHFTFKLPAPAGKDSVAYTLQLTTVSKTGHEAKKSIVVNSAALPVPVLDCGLNGKIHPVDVELKCTSSASENATQFTWKVEQKLGDAVNAVDHAFFEPEKNKDKVIVFTPSKLGIHTVTVVAEGPGGKLSQSTSFEVKSIPVAKITGIEDGKVYLPNKELSASAGQSSLDGTPQYLWTLTNVITLKQIGESGTGVTFKTTLPIGTYQLELLIAAEGGFGGFATVKFVVEDPAKAVFTIKDENGNETNSVPVGAKVTLDSNGSTLSGPASPVWKIAFTPKAGGAPDVQTIEGFKYSLSKILDKPGTYDISLTVGDVAGGTDTATKSVVAKYKQAVGKIVGISSGTSYRQQEMTASGAGSIDTQQYAWSLKKGAVEEASFNAANITFMPADFGAYSLQLIASNEGGDADPVSVAFNVRAAQGMQMQPFTMQAQNAVLALGATDMYVGGAGGLYHLGVDLQWVQVVDAPIYSVWARSSNDVFAGSTDSVFRYTAAKGWQESKNVLMQNGVTSLTGNENRLYAVTNGTQLVRSADNGANWKEVANVMAVHVAAMPNQKMAVATKDGKLQIVDGDAVEATYDPGIAGLVWSGLHVMDENTIFLSATNGKIYLFDGAKLDLLANLPIETLNNVAVQQYAKALWVADGELHAISQDGAHYSMLNGAVKTLAPAGGLSVSAASGGSTIVAVDATSTPFQLTGKGWSVTSSGGDKLLEVKGVAAGWPRIEARSIGTSVFLMNAQSVIDGKTYYLQQIRENGARGVLPVGKPVLDLWGTAANKVYILTANRIYLYDGMTVVDTGIPVIVPNTTEKILAISGDSSHGLRYAATNLGVYRFDANNQFTQLWVSNGGDVTFRSLWVSPSDQIFAGAASGDIVAIKPDGSSKVYVLGDPLHQILGAIEGRLYATTDSKVFKFDEGNDVWVDIPVQGGAAITPHNITMITSINLLISGGASGMLQYTGGILSVLKGLPAGEVAYTAHAGQFSYYGILDPNTGVVSLYKSGPMQ